MDSILKQLDKGFCTRIFQSCAEEINKIVDLIESREYAKEDLAIVLADSSDRNGHELSCRLLKDGFFRRNHEGTQYHVVCFAIHKARLLKMISEMDAEVAVDIRCGEIFPVVVAGYGTLQTFSVSQRQTAK